MPRGPSWTGSLLSPVAWPLHARMAVLLLLASLLPLVIGAWLSMSAAQERLFDDMAQLLQARADLVKAELDAFHAAHQRSADRIARFPAVVAFCSADRRSRAAGRDALRELLATYPASDDAIGGAALVDRDGTVLLSTTRAVEGVDISFRPHLRAALEGRSVISDVYVSISEAGERATIAYVQPVRDASGAVACAAVLAVRASAMWKLLQAANGLAGPGSFALMFDQYGIRIAHSYSEDFVFRPGGALAPQLVERFVAQRRFGARTADLLGDVRPFAQQFERAVAAQPDTGVFRGFAPVNRKWNHGVARRVAAVPWTVFYMSPVENIEGVMSQALRRQLALAGAIIVLALGAGYALAAGIVRRVRTLTAASAAVAAGDLTARVPHGGADEIGRLGEGFNAMVERLHGQSQALQSAHDALEQRVTERTVELRESQSLLQAIVDNSVAAIYVKDLEGRYRLASRSFLEALQLERDAVVGRTDREIHPPAIADTLRMIDEEVARSLAPRIEEESVSAAGELRTYLSVKSPLRDALGVVRGVVGISTDITERKRDQLRLTAQLERLGLLDQITCAIGERQDLQSIYQAAIRSLEERLPADFCCVLGHEPDPPRLVVTRVGARSEPIALELALSDEAVVPIDGDGLSRCLRGELVYQSDIAGSAFEFPARLARSGLRSLVLAPLQSESRVFGVLVVGRWLAQAFSSGECEFLRQLSAHVALAARQAELHGSLQRAYDDLRQTQQAILQQERLRALGQMASGIAHDINNAISPVMLYTESLLEDEPGLSERARSDLRSIARSIDDVAATVARMREFYRQRPAQLELVNFEPNRIVREVVEMTRARWNDMPQQRGIVVRMQLELADDVPAIEGAESEIREALVNLVFNAVDAMPAGGELRLRTRRAADTGGAAAARIEVADSGIGMDEETRRRCLEPFFTTKGERGTGLGLAMVYGAAERHGARLEVHSEPGRGTTISLQFPPPRGDGAANDAQREAPARAARMRILVVDDDPVLLRTLQEMLEHDGHSVVAANGGGEGIDAFLAAQRRGEPFALVLTDLGMPYVDGRRVAAAVKQAAPSTPVVMLTGWGHGLPGDDALPAGVDELLGKPPKLLELRRALLRHGPGSAPAAEARAQ